MERAAVEAWIAAYERVWRSPGVDQLADLFTADCTYRPSPWGPPVEGLTALGGFWEAEREGPDEGFALRSEVIAAEDDVAVARIEVDYAVGTSWRDLWVMRFAPSGRVRDFEEWPFAPEQPDGHIG